MATRNAILLRPHWIILNQLTLPLVKVNDNGKTSIRGLIQLAVPITIFLDTLFNDTQGFTSRSLESDQYHIYKSVEGILQTTGIDGKACLLRTICEMQMNPIGEFTVVGEILTIILTPKRGLSDFLHDYLEAEQIGQSHNMSCSAEYPSCPISLYNLFRTYSNEQASDQFPHDNNVAEDEEDLTHPLDVDSPNHHHPLDAHHAHQQKIQKLPHHETERPFDYINSIDEY